MTGRRSDEDEKRKPGMATENRQETGGIETACRRRSWHRGSVSRNKTGMSPADGDYMFCLPPPGKPLPAVRQALRGVVFSSTQ